MNRETKPQQLNCLVLFKSHSTIDLRGTTASMSGKQAKIDTYWYLRFQGNLRRNFCQNYKSEASDRTSAVSGVYEKGQSPDSLVRYLCATKSTYAEPPANKKSFCMLKQVL